MEKPATIADVFIGCKKEVHYSREVILPQPALVRILSGEVRIQAADRCRSFYAGDMVLLPHNQLGRMSKMPKDGQPCLVISILFRWDRLKQYYAANDIDFSRDHIAEPILFDEHPLLTSLFNSLTPYFELADALPHDIAAVKVDEAVRVLRIINPEVDKLLGYFEAPGKLDLVDFMEKNFMFNLPLEKFAYLTGRSLTTFKKDFQKAFKNSPGKWLTEKRLKLAYHYIFENKRKPSEVYMEAGFENLSHFSFAFKKQFGYPPNGLAKL